ncbi:Cellulose synthase subunit D [Roseomonas rosea]|uniref:Cellulose synthase subunit D n=1 Tax=Muricoccus roseus TaxID=198092 RepID=A0A1M6QIR6_9PROT|nr:cellulose biosynthesis protein BcsD [Roseomonas rosea]SHK20169.1 Cellulose synthase subunit D [Roseomonas rosea]
MTSNSDARPEWEGFLRALLDTLDAHMSPEERAVLLRAIGTQIAALSPIPPEDTLAGLEARMNERLAVPRWGTVSIALDSDGPALLLTHAAPPSLPSLRDGQGEWIGPVLEGLHGGWIGAQPGAEPEVGTQLVCSDEGRMVLRYGA